MKPPIVHGCRWARSHREGRQRLLLSSYALLMWFGMRNCVLHQSLPAMRKENVDRDFRNHPSGGPVRLVTDHEFTVPISRERPPVAVRTGVKLPRRRSCHDILRDHAPKGIGTPAQKAKADALIQFPGDRTATAQSMLVRCA